MITFFQINHFEFGEFGEVGKVGELSVTVVELELDDGGLNVVVHVYV